MMHKNKIDGVKNRITQKLTVCQNFDSLIHLKENIYKIINFDCYAVFEYCYVRDFTRKNHDMIQI